MDFRIQDRPSYMTDADEESRRMPTRSTRNNAVSSSSSSSSSTLRVVASTVVEPTLNMLTTPAQLTEMIESPIATALTNQQPVNWDLFNAANSGSSINASIGTENENLESPIIRPIIHEVPANLFKQTLPITNEALKRNRSWDSNTDNSKRKAAILIILKSEDLVTLISKVRSKPIKSSNNLNMSVTHHAGVLPMRKVKKKH